MLDRREESEAFPCERLALDGVERVLCVAPHPDDEILGPGGLLALLADRGCRIDTLVLTGGEKAAGPQGDGGMAQVRREESIRAAQALGVTPPGFLDLGDRHLRYDESLIGLLQARIDATRPDWVLLPSLSEPHPDHQAVALAGVAAAQRAVACPDLLFYEVGAPMMPNAWVDITPVADRKWRAAQAFVSQEQLQPYEAMVRALAQVRAFGRPDSAAAEAFFRVTAQQLRTSGPAAALPWWPLARVRQGSALTTEQLPLVSVLVRSMDRPQLVEALASVAAQTYPHLEVVVLNASGRPHSPVPQMPGRLMVRVVEPEGSGAGAHTGIHRARAANLALDAAQGALALFLDDDDLLSPQHVERLIDALDRAPEAVAAYSGVRVEGPDAQPLRAYDIPWSAYRLQGINFLPIHAVLFRMDRARALALRFDEDLPVLEDWQFWRKLAEHGHFVHVPGISAIYRQGHGQSGISDPQSPHHWKVWHEKLLERSLGAAPLSHTAQVLAWHAIELDQAEVRLAQGEARLAQAQEQCAQTEARLAHAQAQCAEGEAHLAQAREQCAQTEARLAHTREQLDLAGQRLAQASSDADRLTHALAQMRVSRSWRLTRPLRLLSDWLRKWKT